MKTSIEQLRKANWDALEHDVVTRIRLLRAMVDKLDTNELHDKVANDLILPNVSLLARFCSAVQIDEAADSPAR